MRNWLPRFTLFVAVLSIGLLMAACQSRTPTTQPTAAVEPTQATTDMPTESGNGPVTLTLAGTTTAQPAIAKDVALDPAAMLDADAQAVGGHIFETLVRVDNGAAAPGLARKWTVAEDGLAYTFELRVGARFSDGTAVNADGVIGNFNRWFDPADSMHGSGTYQAWVDAFGGFKGEAGSDGMPKSAFDGIEKIDELTVVLHLNKPVPDLLAKLAGANFGIAHQTTDGAYIGSGAYAVYEKNDTHLLLAPNPVYNGGAAATDNLEYPFK